MNKKTVFILLPLLLALCVVLGIYLGSLLQPSSSKNVATIFPNTTFNTNTKLNDIIHFIEDTYVDTVNKEELTESTISNMLSKLDPHSYYIPATDFDGMNDPLEGNFQGIGIEFRIVDDTVLVVSPIANGPSEKLGIKAGDRIVKVDTINIAGNGITNDKVIKLLKGPSGSKVNVEIIRKKSKKPLQFKITRGKIPLFSVSSSYMINDHTGYLKITRFSKTTYKEFMESTNQLKQKGMKNLIIDLRGNGGGVLSAATEIADEILEKNKMIVYTDGRSRSRQNYYSTNNGSLKNTPIAILINENSASASEILAGAIQDNDRGSVIGRRSFGKGLVQEQVLWPDGSALRLTVARYYSPTGRCIQKPYGTDMDQYNAEAYERYQNGELLSADSIHLTDSLKFYTPQGKVVYGGGGIMPDIFVPLDTSGGTPYLYELRYKGITQDFSMRYVDTHRDELTKKYTDAIDFKNNFKVNHKMFDSMIKFADNSGLKRNPVEIGKSKELITRGLKSLISRDMYNTLGYSVVINDYDKTVQEAINSFNN